MVASLVTAGVSVAGGIGVAGYSARLQRREAAEQIHREKITPYYDTVILMVSTMAENLDPSGQPRQEDIDALKELQHNMLLWSGKEMIKTWTEGMRVSSA